MPDQAAQLRLLVRAANNAGALSEPARPRLLLAASGKGGSGTTTVAIQLAGMLAAAGRRAALIEAADGSADAAAMCGLETGWGPRDVLAARRSLRAAMVQPTHRLYVLAAPWHHPEIVWPAATHCAWSELLAQLAPLVDWTVIDTGRGFTPLLATLWPLAEHVLLVSAQDALAHKACYRLLKSAAAAGLLPGASVPPTWDHNEPLRLPRPAAVARGDAAGHAAGHAADHAADHAAGQASGQGDGQAMPGRKRVWLLLNGVSDTVRAAEVQRRLHRAARRLLGVELSCAGSLPWDAAVRMASVEGRLHELVGAGREGEMVLRRLVRQMEEGCLSREVGSGARPLGGQEGLAGWHRRPSAPSGSGSWRHASQAKFS